ncbi:MAG: MFS transporter [Planctomycetota bacterium]
MAQAPVRKREIIGWCCYDVADSAFTTVIVTTLYALYFGTIVVGDAQRADYLWGLGASISEVAVALLAPLLGAMADFSGRRKWYLGACALLVFTFTASLALVGPGMVVAGIVLYTIANLGFAGGGVFIDSFLPGISTPANAGRISGLKWALGYASGLLALLLCQPLANSIVLHPDHNELTRARMIPLVIAGYYAIAVIPTFLFLRDRSVPQALPPGERLLLVGFRRLALAFRNVRRYRELFKLLVAFLVYNDGVVTVIYFSARYAKETIGFTAAEIVTMFLAMNVVAAVAALGFGAIADQIGQKRTIMISLVIWVAAVAVAFAAHDQATFYGAAVLAGLGIGATQSVTRSMIALFTPQANAAQFYGFLGVAGKALAFAGPLLFGVLSRATGSQRPAILSIGAFFVAGMALLALVDEEKGIAASQIPVVEPGGERPG